MSIFFIVISQKACIKEAVAPVPRELGEKSPQRAQILTLKSHD